MTVMVRINNSAVYNIIISNDNLVSVFPDINECTDGLHGCEQHCDNNHGSYTCFCSSGYRLASDERNCNGV